MDKRKQSKIDNDNKKLNILKEVLFNIENEKSLEQPLLKVFQYLKFVEDVVIPNVGEKDFYVYLKSLTDKAIKNKTILNLKDLNYKNLCKIAFKSSSNVKNYLLNPYPKLLSIMLNVIDDVKEKNTYNSKTILLIFKEKINKRESLKVPLQLYKQNINWKYLSYIESVVIPNVGEREFLHYVEEFLNTKVNRSEMKSYTHTEAYRWILEDGNSERSSLIKSKERYPTIYLIVEEVLQNILSKGAKGKRKLVGAILKNKIDSFNKCSQEKFIDYCRNIIHKEFNEKRKKLNKIEFYRFLFKEPFLTKSFFKQGLFNNIKYINELNYLLEQESLNQKEYLKTWNSESIVLKSDIWIIYFIRGVTIHSIKLDFSLITEQRLKNEIKMFLIFNFNHDNPYTTYKDFSNLMRGLVILQQEFKIGKIADISRVQIAFLLKYLEYNKGYSIGSIKKTVGVFSKLSDYIIDKKKYNFKPTENVFKSIHIHNADAMSKNTSFIPDEVIDQISPHIEKMERIYGLIYEIFSLTGLRPKEVLELETNCFEITKEYEGYVKLNYIPHKIRNVRRRRGLCDHNFIYIPIELYEKIQEYIKENQDIYSNYGLKYLFARRTSHGVAIPKTSHFCLAINKIIKEHNIRDFEGNLWHFTSKQMRKTVAVNLIESGATHKEVANQLGHLDYRTTEKYYLEVRKSKLAELNTEFFKKKFEQDIGRSNLDLYNEEERRQLYVDFCLNKREVEFGSCTKHYSEGECGTRVGASSCTVCPKLCTGIKYMDKWSSLKESQTQVINELVRIYEENGIEDYHDYIEYKKEITLLKRYSNVIEQIKSGR